MKTKENSDKFVLVFTDIVSSYDTIRINGYNVCWAGVPGELDKLIESKMDNPADLVLGNIIETTDDLAVKVNFACRELAEKLFDPRTACKWRLTNSTSTVKEFFSNSHMKLYVIYENGKRYVDEVLYNLFRHQSETTFVTRSYGGMYVRCFDGKSSPDFNDMVE